MRSSPRRVCDDDRARARAAEHLLRAHATRTPSGPVAQLPLRATRTFHARSRAHSRNRLTGAAAGRRLAAARIHSRHARTEIGEIGEIGERSGSGRRAVRTALVVHDGPSVSGGRLEAGVASGQAWSSASATCRRRGSTWPAFSWCVPGAGMAVVSRVCCSSRQNPAGVGAVSPGNANVSWHTRDRSARAVSSAGPVARGYRRASRSSGGVSSHARG
jgi:hypothetical protein